MLHLHPEGPGLRDAILPEEFSRASKLLKDPRLMRPFRKFGLKRSKFREDAGTRIWVGWVVLAANLYGFGQGP